MYKNLEVTNRLFGNSTVVMIKIDVTVLFLKNLYMHMWWSIDKYHNYLTILHTTYYLYYAVLHCMFNYIVTYKYTKQKCFLLNFYFKKFIFYKQYLFHNVN